MTAIASAAPSSVFLIASDASPGVSTTAVAPPASTPTAPQPAVTVSISANATSAAAAASNAPTVQPLSVNATSNEVSMALGAAGDTNATIFIYNHLHWNDIYEKGGEQGVKNLQSSLLDIINRGNAMAIGYESQLPIQSNVMLPTETDGALSGSPTISGGLTVTPFTFSSEGSTYGVTNKNGQIVETKDGKAWQSWGIALDSTPSTTNELLALFASFKIKDAAANSPAESRSTGNAKVNISA